MTNAPECGRCRFFHLDEAPTPGSPGEVDGQCRRHCPVAGRPSDDDRHINYAYWPIVLSSDWCGEFKAREGPCSKPQGSGPTPEPVGRCTAT